MTKLKGLILIIIVLLVSNVIAWFMLFNKKPERADRKAYMREFLQKEVGFTSTQLASFDSLAEIFREKARNEMRLVREKKTMIMERVAAENFSDSSIAIEAKKISDAEQGFELMKLSHTAAIRSLCTLEQSEKFDEGLVKMFRKRVPAKK